MRQRARSRGDFGCERALQLSRYPRDLGPSGDPLALGPPPPRLRSLAFGATLGERFFIDHGMGVVIGETTIVGNDVTLYQGVTLGGTGKETGKRHPTIEDCVVVGVGAAVLGNITVGRGSKVGGGAVVIDDVPPNCTVVGVPGRVVMRAGSRVEAIDLHHEDLPDPVVEMFRCLQRRMDRLEQRAGSGTEGDQALDEATAAQGDRAGSTSVEFEGWIWEI
jgi:serine O-acetyltransferase